MKMCCYVNKMKRIVSVNLFLLVLAGFLSGCYNSGESRERVLKIYNWADYIGEGVLEDFQAYYKEQTGEDIHIVYQTFDINEIMLTKIEKGHEDFDVVCPSEYIIERMLKKHLLMPIDTTFAHSPNYMNNVSPFIREQINKLSQPGEEASRYAVCYMWGTAGILYNRAYVPDSDAFSWECLWDKKYAGKILMKDSYRDAYGTAVIYAHAKELEEGTVYDLRSEYLGEENGIFEESGVYNMIGENIIELVTPSSGAKTYYKVLDDAVVLSDSTEIFNNSGRLAAQYILKRQ